MKRKILIIAIVALVLGGVFYIVKKMLTAEHLYTFNISKTDGLKSILLSKGTVQKEITDLQEIEDTNEVYIYKEISKQLGILPVRLIYKPDRMALKNYEINQDLKKATLLYKHEDEVIKYTMYMNDVDSSFAQKEPDNLINEYVLCLNNGMEIQVKEYEEKEEKVKRYEAEFEYAGAQYEIKGVVEKEEFEKILKNLYFSK